MLSCIGLCFELKNASQLNFDLDLNLELLYGSMQAKIEMMVYCTSADLNAPVLKTTINIDGTTSASI